MTDCFLRFLIASGLLFFYRIIPRLQQIASNIEVWLNVFVLGFFVLKQHLAELCLKLHYKIEKQKATKLCTHSLEGFHCHHKQTNTFLNILDRFPGFTGLHLPWGVLTRWADHNYSPPPIAHDQIVASLLSSPNTDFLLFLFECLPLSVSPPLFFHMISMGHSSYCCSQVQ